MNFVTVEDINGAVFDNQGFWWYEIDTSLISVSEGVDGDFSSVKYDFCRISRELVVGEGYCFTIELDNILFAGAYYTQDFDGDINNITPEEVSNSRIVFTAWEPYLKIYLYMGVDYLQYAGVIEEFILKEGVINLTLKELKHDVQIIQVDIQSGEESELFLYDLNVGINDLSSEYNVYQFLMVNLLKTDFQFQCTQQLIVGEVNTVQLGELTDYKQGGDLVGEYTPTITVEYDGESLPVFWDSDTDDYVFQLDLTNMQSEGKVSFNVKVEPNTVLNGSITKVSLSAMYGEIDSFSKLQNLCRIGGVGRITTDLILTNDLTLSKSVNLIGNDCSIDMASHKLVIPSDLTFKAQSVGFSNGVNSLQQEPNSTVELTDCSFTDCTGFGSVIDCQVDLASLDETDDFTTKLTDCVISDCDMAVLHGGNLEVTGCNVNGKISNKNYPFFLYQTDGNAIILNSEFNLIDDTVYDYDIEFNSCIFTCGETAIINGYSHTELQRNNITAFFETQRNTSVIDVQYYYALIEDTVHLQSSKGYCHSVSGVDYIFKSNVTITRGE